MSSKNRLTERDVEAAYLLFMGEHAAEAQELQPLIDQNAHSVAMHFFASDTFRWRVIKYLMLGLRVLQHTWSLDQQKAVLDLVCRRYGGHRRRLAAHVGDTPRLFAAFLGVPKLFKAMSDALGLETARQLLGGARALAEDAHTDFVFKMDHILGMEINGYAYDKRNPRGGLRLQIFVNGSFITTIKTQDLRRDLQDSVGGDGYFGFSHRVILPDCLKFDGLTQLSIREAETGQILLRNHRFFTATFDDFAYIKRLASSVDKIANRLEAGTLPEAQAEKIEPLLKEIGAVLPSFNALALIPFDGFSLLRDTFDRAPFLPLSSPQALHLCVTKDLDPASLAVPSDKAVVTVHKQAYDELFSPVAAVDMLSDEADDALIFWLEDRVTPSPDLAKSILEAADQNPSKQIFYGDYTVEEKPYFQSRFDIDHLLAANPYKSAFAIRLGALRALCDGRHPDSPAFIRPTALLLAAYARFGADGFHAIGRLIVGYPSKDSHHIGDLDDRLQTLNGLFDTLSLNAKADPLFDDFIQDAERYADIRWPLANSPKLAVIIPTRDALAMVRPCVDSLIKTAGRPDQLDIIIVDNQSQEPETLAWFESLKRAGAVRVLAYDDIFNWSAINNWAVTQTDADYFLFLNNDTKAVTKGWDSRTLEALNRPDIGVVGARLLYEDGSLQHGGCILYDAGVAIHEGAGEPPSHGGYFNRTQLPHHSSAVTGAYLATSRKTFSSVGGFDAENLKITFNDIDFCLKVRQGGEAILYLPQITFYHFESKSRGYDTMDATKKARAMEERAFMEEKWQKALSDDPYYPAIFARQGRAFASLRSANVRW